MAARKKNRDPYDVDTLDAALEHFLGGAPGPGERAIAELRRRDAGELERVRAVLRRVLDRLVASGRPEDLDIVRQALAEIDT